MTALLREKKIKSAIRVLEVFELFDGSRQFVTVMDVARSLDCPQSSTSELLNCLVQQGYLTRDRTTRTYSPTARVALLGAWVQPNLFRYGRLLPMMDELSQECGESIVLGSRVGVALKHVHLVGGTPSADIRTGTEHHLLHSPLGKAMLAMSSGEAVRALVHRINAESSPDMRVRFDDFALQLDAVRCKGFAIGEIGGGRSAIAFLLPKSSGQEQLSLGIILRSESACARSEQIIREARGAIARHLGPVVTHSRSEALAASRG